MLDVLGYVARQTGEHAQARDYYEEALAVYRDLGHTYEEATTLVNLGDTYGDLGRQDEATTARHQALALYRDQHRTVEADRIRRQLDAG
jgi:tetratricopeptide (TPR) repeat protein